MLWLVLVLATLVLVALALFSGRFGPPGPAPSRDVPGVRSALVFERSSPIVDGAPIPDAELLDAIARALEVCGAEPGPWRADREETVELSGTMLGDAFLITLGAVSETRWQLHVYGQPLGAPRYAAPPRTASMKTVLHAIDAAVRALPGAIVIGWQRRQDAFHGADTFDASPTD